MSFTVQEVAQLLKQAKENEKPYVFFTGAGCSVRADVPTATEFIQEICKKFPIQVKNIDPEKDKYNYGKYMSALDKSERRELLKPHIIDNKKINWAHIALACLMQGGYIQRVLTFNFDSILSRACNLLGLHPSIYDFATANPHLYHLINDPSIVHLHGQGTGFVQLNTQEETLKHTEQLGDFIASTLNSNPSLFIGYSGNADEFFPLLEKKYSEQHRLIWTGRKENIDLLEVEPVKGFLKKNNNLTHYIGSIDADDFLIQLAKELEYFPPELFSNPYRFLDQQLENIQPYPLGDGLDILENLTGYLKEQAEKPLNKSLYTAVIHKYPNKESTKGLTEKAINDIMWAYDQQAHYLKSQDKFEESHKVYDQALAISARHYGCLHNYALSLATYANIKSDQTLFEKAFDLNEQAFKLQPSNADNLGNYALALSNLARINQDELLFEKAFEQFQMTLKILPNHAGYLNNYGVVLADLAKLKNDENLFNNAFEQYQSALKIQPNHTYNLACYYSIKNNKELCKENLLHAVDHNTLPSSEHLNEDKDLDNVRTEQWFIDLLERLKEKEQKDEAA
ncbi:hypothetical protein BEN74_18410 [Acinetobacter sp. WCHAc010034]|uniref:TPR end-of-group domain-containing protein n=1 Tax=Acinetobacter sp. WCHAc010034 TaxID=1879049 RepID=UPI00083A8307|nr:SIR2 family protein [Acinetobacter sp. WCHAc010034]AYA04563.1 hypothetical protein BEN74_18410 [Acinetobacter sp. WCHAc010034]